MREDVISYQTQVNGFPATAVYSRQTVEEVLVPLLQKFTALWEERGRRIVIFLAAPPAAGKSTLALFLQHLSEMLPGVRPLQAAHGFPSVRRLDDLICFLKELPQDDAVDLRIVCDEHLLFPVHSIAFLTYVCQPSSLL